MIIVDSCGWLEWFTDGELADSYEKYIINQEKIFVPAIVLFEVYKILKKEVGEEKALLAAGYMKTSQVIPFDESLAFAAADVALERNLAMADAIICATAKINNCRIITSDVDFKGLPGVEYIAKKT